MKRIKWNGEYYEDKDGIIFPMDLVPNKEGEDNRSEYNKVLTQPAFWDGCKAPVLVGYEMVSFAVPPSVITAIETKYKIGESSMKKKVKNFLSLKKKALKNIQINLPLHIPKLYEYIDASTAAYERHSFDKGRLAGRLEMTKPAMPAALKKLALPLGFILLMLLLAGSGAFGDIGGMISGLFGGGG